MTRPVLAALLCGLALRWGAAVLTEFHPILPAYHYTDAGYDHDQAVQVAKVWRSDSGSMPASSASKKLYVHWVALQYRLFGAQKIVPKLVNGLFAAAGAFLWYRIALMYFPGQTALIFLWMLAIWPSSVFFSSQNLKEASIGFFAALAFHLFSKLQHLERGPHPVPPKRLAILAGGGAISLFVLGMLRSHLMAFAAGALALSAGIVLVKRLKTGTRIAGPAATLVSIALLLGVFKIGSAFVAQNLLYPDPPSVAMSRAGNPSDMRVLPATYIPNSGGEYVRPFSPRGLTRFRNIRHSEAMHWARSQTGRVIATQVLPDVEFASWLDVALFLPKGFLYAAFMPLPGFYPLDGKLARILASLENVLLLTMFIFAVLQLKSRPLSFDSPWFLLAFFVISAGAYSLFEFDLGSAARHRLQYFPSIFLFAAAFLSQRFAPALRAKVLNLLHA